MQGEIKWQLAMRKKKSERELIRYFLHKTWKFQVVVVQNNVKETYKKKCAARAAHLALHVFIFCLKNYKYYRELHF